MRAAAASQAPLLTAIIFHGPKEHPYVFLQAEGRAPSSTPWAVLIGSMGVAMTLPPV
jgi:hypothetical protein